MALVLNGSGTITGLNAGGLPDGSITSDDLASSVTTGKVLQVVSDSDSTQQLVNTGTWVDSALSVSITPATTSSKILLQCYMGATLMEAGEGGSLRFVRDSTAIYTPGGGQQMYTYSSTMSNTINEIAIDSPNTTSSIVYKVQFRGNNAYNINVNYGGNYKSWLIATEIGV